MCGISGWYNQANGTSLDTVRSMNSTLSPRGPDSDGFYTQREISLGHRRLAIIDLSPGGHQPMTDGSGNYVITFNGEIYNFNEIRHELRKKGHVFRSESDTEVVLEAYSAWGSNCLSKFNGMFALAIWDKQKKELFLARDRLGKKPLFYFYDGENFLFASEIKALLASGKIPKKLDPVAVRQYLNNGYVYSDRSIIANVQKLKPGHFLNVSNDNISPQYQYWNLLNSFLTKTRLDENEAKTELLRLIDDATRIRMISDVPLGAFLSGGIDSAAIVAAMNRFASDPVHTYSIGFKEKSFSEIEQAKDTAKFLKTQHRDKIVDLEFAKYLEKIVLALDEPMADNSIVPTYFLSEFARNEVTIALTGDGGDELFLGYETYIADKIKEKLNPIRFIWRVLDFVQSILPVSHAKISFDFKFKKFLRAKNMGLQESHYSWRQYFYPDELETLLQDDFKRRVEHLDSFEDIKSIFSESSELEQLDQFSYFDIKTWLVDDVLMKCDRMSMAHSLELRSPFLDYRIVEFAASLPVNLKLKGVNLKYILKQSQAKRLPRDLLKKKKLGFNSPVAHWLKSGFGSEVKTMIAEGPIAEIVKPSEIEKLLVGHERMEADNSYKLFNLVVLNKWMQIFLK